MYTEDIHIGVTAKTSKVIGTIEFEEEDLIREGLGRSISTAIWICTAVTTTSASGSSTFGAVTRKGPLSANAVSEALPRRSGRARLPWTSLDSGNLPKWKRRFGEGAFEDCEKLDTVVFGTGLKRIKKHAFHNCKVLTKVNLPDEISNYSVALFEGCSNLSELTMPEWMEKRRLDIMDYAHGKK